MDFKKILDTYEMYKDKEDEIQKAYEDFFAIIAKDSFAPIIDRSISDWFLEWIWLILPKLKEDIERFYYDIDINKKDTREIIENWKEYKINSRDDFIKYLEETYLDY